VRWITGQCNTTLWQWKCLSKQSLLQLHSAVSDSSFQDRRLHRSTLLVWVSNWYQEGSVKDYKPQGLPRSVHTTDNVERVRNAILRSPHRSAQRHALARRLKDNIVRRIVHKVLHYHLFAREIQERDKVSRL